MNGLNKNLFGEIVNFLNLKDILTWSQVNKRVCSMIQSEEIQSKINLLFKEACINYFYENLDDEDDDEETKKKKSIINSKKDKTINWKNLFKFMLSHKKNLYFDKENYLENQIYDILKEHIYLQKIRKSNDLTDRNLMTNHQIYFLDIYHNQYIDLFYSKIINNNQNQNEYISEILTLSSSNEFWQLKEEIKNNELYSDFISQIFDYSYYQDYLDFSTIKIENKLIYFIAWFYQCIKSFCFMNLCYIQHYNTYDEEDSKIFIDEYCKRHSNFASAALSIDENLKSVAFFINEIYLYLFFKEGTKGKRFSLYKFIMNIWYTEVYQKLKNDLIGKSDLVIQKFVDEDLENITKVKIPKNSSEDNEEMDVENDEDDDDYDENENMCKNVVENLANCVLDFSIDENNADEINKSDVCLSKDYEKLEYKIISSIKNKINSLYLNKLIRNDSFIKIIKFINKEWNFINRTKQLIISYVMIEMKNEILDYIRNQEIVDFINNKIKSYYSEDIYTDEDCSTNEESLDFVNSKIENDLNALKSFLINCGFSNECVCDYLFNSKCLKINVMKETLKKYYFIVDRFNTKNELIRKFNERSYRINCKNSIKNLSSSQNNNYNYSNIINLQNSKINEHIIINNLA